MVPPYSIRISRVPTYSSSPTTMLFQIRDYHPLSLAFPNHSLKTMQLDVTGLFPFRSPLLRKSRLISFPLGTEMFQFSRFASLSYVFRQRYLLRGGFPHSDISGSMLICQLPEAFRRLTRLSSPSTAKASTVCTYSLDHITLSSFDFTYLSLHRKQNDLKQACK
jgi:hypothetical protein